MEIEDLYHQFTSLDSGIIDELYRTFVKQDYSKDSEIDENFNKVTTAVAFCNLLAYEPDSVTEFHRNHMKSLFTEKELDDLYRLVDWIFTKNTSSLSAV